MCSPVPINMTGLLVAATLIEATEGENQETHIMRTQPNDKANANTILSRYKK